MHILFFWFSKKASIASNGNVSPAGNNRLLERLLLSCTVWGSYMSPAWTGLGHGAFCFSYHAMSLMIKFKHLIYHVPFYKQMYPLQPERTCWTLWTWKCFPLCVICSGKWCTPEVFNGDLYQQLNYDQHYLLEIPPENLHHVDLSTTSWHIVNLKQQYM